MNIRAGWILAVAGVSLALTSTAAAQCASEVIVSPDVAAGDGFGAAVALDGSTLVVGASHHDLPFVEGGAVYVYERVGGAWILGTKLAPQDGAADDLFGSAVAISGDRIAVASKQVNDIQVDIFNTHNIGAVYLFERGTSGWIEVQRFVPEPWMSGFEDQTFGQQVCLSGDTLAVHSSYRKNGGIGALYGMGIVYTNSGASWTYQFRSDGYARRTLAMKGDRLASGYTGVGEQFPVPGNVQLYERVAGAWSPGGLLQANDPSEQFVDRFGAAIALDGERVLVGAPTDELPDDSVTGSAYVYLESGGVWAQEAQLLASDAQSSDWFGARVALDGAFAVVAGKNKVYVFERVGVAWSEIAQLSPGDIGFNSFPSSLALDGETVAAGSMQEDAPFVDAGATHVYELGSCPVEYCASVPNSSGAAALIGIQGSLDVAANDCWLTAADCPPNQTGAFLYGANPAEIPFGDGYLCVAPFAPGIHRLWPPLATSASGDALRQLDFTNLPPAGAITAGSTWYFQFWYRDPLAGGTGSNTTGGLQVSFGP